MSTILILKVSDEITIAKPNDRMRAARLAVVLCLLYAGADLALNRVALGDGWTILWPLNGASIGLLLMRPRSDWAAIVVGIAVGTGFGEFFDNNPLSIVILQRCFSVIEVLLCALVLPPFTSLDRWLRTPRLALRFCSALVLGPGVSGILDALVLHQLQGGSYLNLFHGWSVADALGIAATLPLVLSLRTPEMRALFRSRALPRTLGMLTLAFGTVSLIFNAGRYPLLFLLYPVLLLVDLMLTFVGASIANLGVSFLAVYFTIHHPGALGGWHIAGAEERDFTLQFYLGFHLVALLPASIVLLERRWMTEQISEANAQLILLASVDGLTGVANRRTFDERLAREWNTAIRHGTQLALMMIDIDCFKLYNDHYGHLAGDACLRTVASLLLGVTGRPQDLPARYGGEEFVILLPETSLQGAIHQAEQLRSAVFDQSLKHQGSPWQRVTLSVGCACLSPHLGEAGDTLLGLADQALYNAKQSGRNKVCSSSLNDSHPLPTAETALVGQS